MNAAPNLQAAADQWRKNYREMTSPDGSVLEAVRSMNEKTVVQTREVYDRSTDAFDATFSTFERTFDAAGQGVVASNRKFVDITQRNVNATFDLAKSIAGSRNLAEQFCNCKGRIGKSYAATSRLKPRKSALFRPKLMNFARRNAIP